MPGDLVAEDVLQLRLRQHSGLSYARLARVAVQIRRHDQPLPRQRVTVRHHGALAARQNIAWCVALAPQADPVGIGEGGHGRRAEARIGPVFPQPFGLCLDPGDGTVMHRLSKAVGALYGAQAQCEVHAATAQRVTLGQQGGQRRRTVARPFKHMRKPGMQRRARQRAPVIGDPIPRVQPTQQAQQAARLGQASRMGRGDKGHVRLGPAPKRQFERKARQIAGLDLGRRIGGKRSVLAPGPQLVAAAGCHPACAARALRGLGAGHTLGHQPRHARRRIEHGAPRPATIHDDPNVRNGQRCLGDGGGEHDLSRVRRRDRRPLCLEVHRTKERLDRATTGQASGQRRLHPPDLTFTRQKGEQPPFGLERGVHDQVCHGGLEPRLLWHGPVEPLRHDVKALAFGGQDMRLHHLCDRCGIQRCRHRQQDQVVAQGVGDLKAKGQAQVSIQRPFMKLVKDHGAHTRQLRIGLQHAGQDAFGHHLDSCRG